MTGVVRTIKSETHNYVDEDSEERFLLALALADGVFLAASFCWTSLEISFHCRQPSKSISACIHPHSMTFRSSQTKLTG